MLSESIDKNRLVSSVFTQARHHHAYKLPLIHAAKVILSCLCLICMEGWATAQEVPVITGEAKFDGAAPLLDWPRDYGRKNPNLEEPSANILFDLHAQIRECDIALSTSGNFHMALLDLWKEEFLPSFPEDAPIGNWMYTTSPPISVEQLQEGHVQFGNFLGACPVQVAGGPGRVMNKLKDMGVVEGDPLPLLSNYGNVLLVKKGNPKNIQSIWDLGREDVTVVTSNPVTEAGSFSNYRDSIYRIALNDPEPPEGMTADKLFDRVFNGATGREGKWVSGARIHHREVPWSIAYGQADAGPFFYHLALYATRQFPDLFEIVPLGGDADNPDPLPGNRVATMNFVRIKGEWSEKQSVTVDRLFATAQSDAFTKILERHGLRRPVSQK